MEPNLTDFDQYVHASQAAKVDEVDNLSTNLYYKQMDREKEEMEEETESTASLEDVLQLNPELQTGYKILMDLMSDSKKAVNWPFMESVEMTAPELFEDYKKRIEKPMWLKLMKQKFVERQYESITEFVADFRSMLENCYRFNGPDHYISRRGQKLETMLEQKLNLLSRELKEKTSIETTSGLKQEDGSLALGLRRRHKAIVPHDSTLLLNQLREEEQQKVREYRKQQMADRKAEKEALAQEILDWEDSVLFAGRYRDQMKSMWELPQIGLFLFLCQGPLNIGEVMHYELERCFLIPRESSTMQLIMMSLLSTPFQRMKIDRKYLMPYKVWEQKLRIKMQAWYKVFTDTGYHTERTCTKLGFDEQFFEILGKKNPMEKKKYHELSYYKRVWIVKALCDHLMQTQESLRETIELQPFADQREYVLGTDAEGLRYIHFPQFCGADLRIYRQAPFKYPKIEIKPDSFDNKRKFPFVYKPPPLKKVKLKKKKKIKKPEVSPVQSPVRSRPSRLRQTPKSVIPLNYGDSSDSSGSSSDEPDTNNDTATELEESAERDDAGESDKNDLSSADIDADTKSEDRVSSGSDATIPYCDKSDSNSCTSSRDCSRESSPYPTPTDVHLGLRRSSRFDRSSDVSREASPLIDESDFGLRRSSRNMSRFKNIPPLRATRDLTSFLLDENSTTSNSSAFGEYSNSGIWKNGLVQTENSVSSGEDSNNCDIRNLFSASKLGRNRTRDSENSSVCKELTTRANTSLKEETEMISGLRNEIGVENQQDSFGKEVKNLTMETDDDAEMTSDSNVDSKLTMNDSEQVHIEQSHTTCDNDEKTDTKNHSSDDPGTSNTQRNTELGTVNCSVDSEHHETIADESSDKENADESDGHIRQEDVNMETETDTGDGSTLGCEKRDTFTDMSLSLPNSGLSFEVNHDECDKVTGSHLSDDNFQNRDMSDINLDIPENVGKRENKTELKADLSQSLSHPIASNRMEQDTVTCAKSKDHVHTEYAKSEFNTEEEMNAEESEGDISSKIGLLEARVDYENLKQEELEDLADIKSSNISDNSVKSSSCEGDSSAASDVKIKVEPEDYNESNTNEGDPSKLKCSSHIKTEDHTNNIEQVLEKPEADIKVESPTAESTTAVKAETLTSGDGQDQEEPGSTVKEEKTDLVKEESEEEEEEEEKVPDISQFELLADSVEALRSLTEEFAEPEPIIIKRGKKEQIARPPPRKKNVVHLHERLEYLLKELEPWEFKLLQATKRARLRLRKEMESYIEPPQEEEGKWNTTDEETESGDSDDDTKADTKDEDKAREDASRRTKAALEKVLSANNSRSSTPVKLEEPDEIDISQRGRLRKRRIIPNNVEDQFAIKKTRSIPKSEPASTSVEATSGSQPVIIQSGKPQMVDYSDILRQIKSASSGTVPGVSPILIKTTQGGRTVLTSVLPIASGSGAGNVANLQGLQNIRFLSPPALTTQSAGQQQPVRLAVPLGAGLGPTKVSQHPTIQTLLSTTSAPSIKVVPKTSTTSSILQLLPQVSSKPSGASAGALQTVALPSGQQIIMKAQTPAQPHTLLMQQPNASQKVVLQGQTTPQKIVLPNQTTPQKVALQGHITPPKTSTDSQITPRKIAPHTSAPTDSTAKGKVKYYAANASTLPINVVQQLLATRGAKLQTGPNQQSILFIPMESEGQTRNVTSVTKSTTTPIKHQFLSPIKTNSDPEQSETGSQQASGSSADDTVKSVTQSKVLTTVTNTPILPKPQAGVPGSPVVTLAPGIQLQPALNVQTGAQAGNQSNVVKVSKTVRLPDGSISLNVKTMPVLPPTSPPRYPTNETVRNLLDKRKYGEEKVYPSTTYPCIASQLQGITPKPLSSSVILKGIPSTTSPGAQSATTAALSPNLASPSPQPCSEPQKLLQTDLLSSSNHQQCVITTISPAKLNTLLLQTNAAGAKTYPSLIKLPSKAVLDSAVKAVVTSVSTSLPTVNIKVPSPTSLPSIGPRRNVTKTIQTMKSPIPVAPKVVTQNSGMTTLSVGSANATVLSSQTMALSSGKAAVSMTSPTGPAQPAAIHTTPQTVLTSKGLVQMGYLTPQGMVIPKTQATVTQTASAMLNHIGLPTEASNQALQGMQLIQNCAGQLQLVPRSSPLLQQMSQKTGLLQLSVSTPQNTLTQSTAQRPLLSVGTVGSSSGLVVASQNIKDTPPVQLISNTTSPVILPRSTALFTTTPAKSPIMGMSASKSPVLSVPIPIKSPVLRGPVEAKSPTPGMGAGFILPQSAATGVVNPAQSPVSSQAPVSPLLSMQQNLVLQGGRLQLAANPVINPLGLLQQGVALQSPGLMPNSQNVQLLQNSLASPALQQMVNVNPLLLNQLVASSANMILHRAQLPASSVSMAGKVTNLMTSVAHGSQVNKPHVVYQANASSVLSGAAKHVASMVNRVPVPSTNVGLSTAVQGTIATTANITPKPDSVSKQFIFQYNVPNQRSSAVISQPSTPTPPNVVKNLNTTFASVGQSQDHVKPAANHVPIVQPQTPGVVEQIASIQPAVVTQVGNQQPGSSVIQSYAVASPVGANAKTTDPNSKTSPGHQKLLLFSIGGQLVTGQGVPVTLSDGVLKLMPQGKIQIANQTLTPAQIQQTLAKINQGLNVVTQPGVVVQQQQQQQAPQNVISAVKPAALTSTMVPAGINSTMVPAGINSTMVPAGINSTMVPAGINSTMVPAGINSTMVPAGINSTMVPAGINSTMVPAGINSTMVPSGMTSAIVPSGINSTMVPAGINSTMVPAGINSTMVPSGINSTMVPAGINSTLVPSGINRTMVPSGINSTMVTAGINSIMVPAGINSTIVPSGMTSAIVPSGINSTMFPSGINSTMVPAGINSTMVPSSISTMVPSGITNNMVPSGINSTIVPAGLTSSMVPSVASQTQTQAQAGTSSQYKDHDYQHKDKSRPISSPSPGANTVAIPLSSPHDKNELFKPSVSNVALDTSSGSDKSDDGLDVPPGSEGKTVTLKSGVPVYVMPRSNNTQYVMKPMVYSSGYIVCPRTEKDKDSTGVPVVTDINKAQEVFRKAKFVYGYDKEGFIVKAPVKTEVNGKSDLKSPDSLSGANEIETMDEDEEPESNLVIDDSINEKEAALNLLTLANQALAPVKVKSESQVDKSGDAPEDFSSSR